MNRHHRKLTQSPMPVTRGPTVVRKDNEWAIYPHLLTGTRGASG
jgi:hypothetical protein